MPHFRSPDLRLMTKVARLYYLEDLSQEEIGARYNTSRSTVSRLLKQARELGILRIGIQEPESSYTDLEDALERRYGLREAVVVPEGESAEATLERLGEGGAWYLQRAIRPGMVVGVSWGWTLRKVAEALRPQSVEDVTVVPMIGGSGRTDPKVHANQIANRIARAFDGDWLPLHAPALASTPDLRNTLMADPATEEVMSLARRAGVALVGIGSPNEGSTMIQTGYLGPEEMERVRAAGAVGDILSQYFDADGRPAVPEIARRVVGLPLEDLRRLPLVVGVAGGPAKVPAIRGALAGRFLSVLVTDAVTARELLA